MTLELPVDETYVEQFERIQEKADDDFAKALARVVESQIHANFQEIVLNDDTP